MGRYGEHASSVRVSRDAANNVNCREIINLLLIIVNSYLDGQIRLANLEVRGLALTT